MSSNIDQFVDARQQYEEFLQQQNSQTTQPNDLPSGFNNNTPTPVGLGNYSSQMRPLPSQNHGLGGLEEYAMSLVMDGLEQKRAKRLQDERERQSLEAANRFPALRAGLPSLSQQLQSTPSNTCSKNLDITTEDGENERRQAELDPLPAILPDASATGAKLSPGLRILSGEDTPFKVLRIPANNTLPEIVRVSFSLKPRTWTETTLEPPYPDFARYYKDSKAEYWRNIACLDTGFGDSKYPDARGDYKVYFWKGKDLPQNCHGSFCFPGLHCFGDLFLVGVGWEKETRVLVDVGAGLKDLPHWKEHIDSWNRNVMWY